MRTLNISEETYTLIKDQLKEEEKLEVSSYEDLVGKSLFIRTVTYHLIGKVEKVIGHVLQLSQAVWVAESGRFMNAIAEGTLNEVEPIKAPWFVNMDSVTDFGIWNHPIPTEQK